MYLQNHEDGLESDAYDHLFQTKQHQYVVTWLGIPLALRAGAGITSHFRASVGRQSMYYYPSYCRAFLAQRRGATQLGESTKSDRRDGGLKMDWTKPRAGCSHLWVLN